MNRHRVTNSVGNRGAILVLVALCTALCGAVRADGLCKTELATIRADYESARMSSCKVVAPDRFELANEPESTPINPSPWYGFVVERSVVGESVPLAVSISYLKGYGHRYIPKFSLDGLNWRRANKDEFRVDDTGTTHLVIPPGAKTTFVSAQEVIASSHYVDWIDDLKHKWRPIEERTIGFSHDRHAITALMVNANANAFVLLIGRQHPPEVTGAMAMMAFVDHLAHLRYQACVDAPSERCEFFRRHGLIIVPLVNPDGVARGHWRHNMGMVDLNRDWGQFNQPETRAVRDAVNVWIHDSKSLRLVLDFHSTNRNVLYTQTSDDDTRPPNFAPSWLAMAEQIGLAEAVELAPRELSDLGTAKNFFYLEYGVPSITYEVADTADRRAVVVNARAFAEAMVDQLVDEDGALEPSRPGHCTALPCLVHEAQKASLFMLDAKGLIDPGLATNVAEAMIELDSDMANGLYVPSGNYLVLEEELIERVGTAAANVHVGRSRQDLHGTARRMMVRQKVLNVMQAALAARRALIERGRQDADTVVPSYTHGVPAQPTTFGHQCLAFSQALGRDLDRLAGLYERLNRSPLGAAAGNTSGFDLDRELVADLLGFDGPVVNAFDANFLSSADYKIEFASVVAQSALMINQFVQNLHSQQRNPHPWIFLSDELVSGSSIMPQKRNPRPLDRLRSVASELVASSIEQKMLLHNVASGMHDYRKIDTAISLADQAGEMYRRFVELIQDVKLNPEAALADINRGYSTSTEVADTLFRDAGVPFRDAHSYTARLIEIARAEGLPLTDLQPSVWTGEYERMFGSPLPVPLKGLLRAVDPTEFVARRKGMGGPQSSEMAIRLDLHAAELKRQREYVQGAMIHLDQKDFERQKAIESMLGD